MVSFFEDILNNLFKLNIEDTNINNKIQDIIKYINSPNINNNTKLNDEIKVCIKKNISDTPKLCMLINNISQYKLYDFLIDCHKLPHNIIEIKNFLLICCILLFILIILIVVFFIIYNNNLNKVSTNI